MSSIEDLYRKVHIHTGAEALSFVRLRTMLDLPFKSDSFRGSEIMPPSQFTRQIGFEIPWIYQQSQVAQTNPHLGIMPEVWYLKNHLYPPLVKGLGFKWSIKRLVLQRLPNHKYLPGVLEETVDVHGAYHADLRPLRIEAPPGGWGN